MSCLCSLIAFVRSHTETQHLTYQQMWILRTLHINVYTVYSIYTLKNAGFSLLGHFIGLFLISLPRCLGVSLYSRKCWVIFLTQMLGSVCWVILLGSFSFIFFTQVLGSFSVTKLLGHLKKMLSYFFQPNCWVETAFYWVICTICYPGAG